MNFVPPPGRRTTDCRFGHTGGPDYSYSLPLYSIVGTSLIPNFKVIVEGFVRLFWNQLILSLGSSFEDQEKPQMSECLFLADETRADSFELIWVWPRKMWPSFAYLLLTLMSGKTFQVCFGFGFKNLTRPSLKSIFLWGTFPIPRTLQFIWSILSSEHNCKIIPVVPVEQ